MSANVEAGHDVSGGGVAAAADSAPEKMRNQLDLLDKFLSIAFKLGVFLGGLVFLLYCESINYLPRDMSLGDGFFLVFVAAGFGAVYLFFLASLTCFGILMISWWSGIQWCYVKFGAWASRVCGRAVTSRLPSLKHADLGQWVMGLLGAGFVIGFASKAWIRLPLLLVVAIFCALFVEAYQKTNVSLLVIANSGGRSNNIEKRRVGPMQNKLFICLMILIVPMIVGGVATDIIAGAMRLLNVRRDDVVANIEKPYSTLIAGGGVAGARSALGEEYTEYPHVDVLLSGIGSNTVLSLKTPGGNELRIAVPTDKVLYSSRSKRMP